MEAATSRRYLLTLSLAALGVVYGDIGTSPLYALKECFMVHHGHQIVPTHDNVLGVLSLITWSLILVISIKYLVFVLRADNRGEGGILALMSLVKPREAGRRGVRRGVLIGLGLFGSALLYGDGMITPAITMLSAFEGVDVVTPALRQWVVPLTVMALIVLFAVQKYGTARVGTLFGPLMLVWFSTLAALGIYNLARAPEVIAALNPLWAAKFMMANHVVGYLVLGAVFLVVTGGEALYADMGHFGARPIRLAWFTAVFPALLLNYFGQGALLLRNPAAASDPFFLMAPRWAMWPLVILSTLAAAVASQAVISGAFSLTRQAVQLTYLPRVHIQHTSAREIGQIYIPSVNWGLMLSAIGLVIGFGAATNLAGAYGVAVTATMGITTALFAVVARERWGWSRAAVLAVAVPFLAFDLAFFGANVVKVADGGWFPILVGVIVFTLMSTWYTGRHVLANRLAAEATLDEESFVGELAAKRIHRVRGTSVFLTRQQKGIPTALLHNIKHNKIVHECVVLLSVNVDETPYLSEAERADWRELGEGVYRLILHFGFLEEPDLPATLARLTGPISFQPMTTSYFLGRETLIATRARGMAVWREHLFAWMNRNATSAASFFSLPENQVIELGAQVRI
jgi:KUP system potassium uptake protein